MRKKFFATPIGESTPRKLYYRSRHNPMKWSELEKLLSHSWWQPLKNTVHNFDYVKAHKDLYPGERLYSIIQDAVITSLDGSTWWIIFAEDLEKK